MSMGQEGEAVARNDVFADYRVTVPHMRLAAQNALFLHCLPAHPGEGKAKNFIAILGAR